MNSILSLDLGARHTGVAFADSSVNIALPLDTIHHETEEELLGELKTLVESREITTILIGLPVLLSGKETEQTEYTRELAEKIQNAFTQCSIELVDERGTSKNSSELKSDDPHAEAAVEMLRVWLERQKSN